MSRDQCYSIQQLATHARVSVASVRYYIQKGEVPRPHGSRTKPCYNNSHLKALMRVRHELSANVRIGHIHESQPYPAHTIKVSSRE